MTSSRFLSYVDSPVLYRVRPSEVEHARQKTLKAPALFPYDCPKLTAGLICCAALVEDAYRALNACQGVANLVGQACRQLTDSGEPIRPSQLLDPCLQVAVHPVQFLQCRL